MSIKLSTMDSSMEVANGMKQVRFLPCIRMSPGNLPRGIFSRDKIKDRPASKIKMIPITRNTFVMDGFILTYVNT